MSELMSDLKWSWFENCTAYQPKDGIASENLVHVQSISKQTSSFLAISKSLCLLLSSTRCCPQVAIITEYFYLF